MNKLGLELEWISESWACWMTNMSIQLAILVSVLVVVDGLLRRYSARLRHTLWLLVLVRLLLPPDLAAPTSLVWWIRDLVPVNVVTGSDVFGHLPGVKIDPSATGFQADRSIDARNISSVKNLPDLGLSSVLFLFWFGMVCARMAFLLFGQLQIRKWLRSAKEIKDDVALSLLATAKLRVGVHRHVSLRDCAACSTPLVTGWYQTYILLPTNVRLSLSPSELESVLVHELSHVARWDGFSRWIQALFTSFYFFHPGMWIANRYLRRTCEDACDEMTIVALAGKRRCYAEAIFKAATLVGYEPPHLALSMLDDTYPVKLRLRRILDPHLNVTNGGALARRLVFIVAGLILLPSGVPTSAGALVSKPAAKDENIEKMAVAETPVDRSGDERIDFEKNAIDQVQSNEFEVRLAGYETLQRIGTVLSLEALETAYLKRGGVEQDVAKRALDAVWKKVKSTPSQSRNPDRLFQGTEEL